MNNIYLGHLPHADPLYGYLCHDILPQVASHCHNPSFRVFQSVCSRNVYLYEERQSGVRVVGKFYPSQLNTPQPQMKGEIEYNNLLFLRSLGLAAPPHYVVKPLGFHAGLGGLLIMEHLQGDTLGTVINHAIYQGEHKRLYRKLTSLAHFLATMHNRTAGDWNVVFTDAWSYTGRLIRSLVEKRGMGQGLAAEFSVLRDLWRERACMWEDKAVLVHGDVTPSNFLFGTGNQVMAIDLERMHWADRRFDLGRLCGELKHFFCQGTGNFGAAEPFIGHFLWEYSCHFPDREQTFAAITKNMPFYIGITMLRIARNSWIAPDYRWRLVQEAIQTLRALP